MGSMHAVSRPAYRCYWCGERMTEQCRHIKADTEPYQREARRRRERELIKTHFPLEINAFPVPRGALLPEAVVTMRLEDVQELRRKMEEHARDLDYWRARREAEEARDLAQLEKQEKKR